ncbi:hypothetical protein A5651_13410 [Mycobacterium sp. 1274761.0]|nr:hypothetical protein A5651_13410 [Mycobacterium sp. 1274761.0]
MTSSINQVGVTEGLMSGKHRKRSGVASTVAKRGSTGFAAAAISATGLSTAVMTGTTAAVAPDVQLMALVSAANSTSQFFAGSSYYGTDWTQVYGQQQVVPFLLGPQGIANAIASHRTDPTKTGVTASGWGAGQAGTALSELSQADRDHIGLVILDNNTNRAGGGFWTTYYPFAPLLLTTADPTPSDLAVGGPVLDVAYEYNINSDAPVDPLNPFALGNSLAAYAFDYGAESRALDITQKNPGDPVVLHQTDGTPVTLEPGRHYIVKDGQIVNYEVDDQGKPVLDQNGNRIPGQPVGGTTTFVTVEEDNLPLTRPLRLIPGGDIIADAIDPTMTDLVNAGYNDGLGVEGHEAIPANPRIERPMKPFSSLSALNAGDLAQDAQDGVGDGTATAVQDITDPTRLVTKPLGEIGKLPGLSSLTNSVSAVNPANAPAPNNNNVNRLSPGNTTGGGSSSTSTAQPKPLKKISDDFNSSLKKFAEAVHPKPAVKPASKTNTNDNDTK